MTEPVHNRSERLRISLPDAWVVCGLTMAAAAVIGWFATYMSASALSANQSDGSDPAIFLAIYLAPAGVVVASLCLPTVLAVPSRSGAARSAAARPGTTSWVLVLAVALAGYVPVLAAGYARDDQTGGDLPGWLVTVGLVAVLLASTSAALLRPPRRVTGWAVSNGAVAVLWATFALVAGTHL